MDKALYFEVDCFHFCNTTFSFSYYSLHLSSVVRCCNNVLMYSKLIFLFSHSFINFETLKNSFVFFLSGAEKENESASRRTNSIYEEVVKFLSEIRYQLLTTKRNAENNRDVVAPEKITDCSMARVMDEALHQKVDIFHFCNTASSFPNYSIRVLSVFRCFNIVLMIGKLIYFYFII